jgi:hypothetical protein
MRVVHLKREGRGMREREKERKREREKERRVWKKEREVC